MGKRKRNLLLVISFSFLIFIVGFYYRKQLYPPRQLIRAGTPDDPCGPILTDQVFPSPRIYGYVVVAIGPSRSLFHRDPKICLGYIAPTPDSIVGKRRTPEPPLTIWVSVQGNEVIENDYPDSSSKLFVYILTHNAFEGSKIPPNLISRTITSEGNTFQTVSKLLVDMGCLHDSRESDGALSHEHCRDEIALEYFLKYREAFADVSSVIRQETHVIDPNLKAGQLQAVVNKRLLVWQKLSEYWNCESEWIFAKS